MFVFYFVYLFMDTLCGMWGLSSLTRDRNNTPCSGSAESWPLDSQGSPWGSFLKNGTSNFYADRSWETGPGWGGLLPRMGRPPGWKSFSRAAGKQNWVRPGDCSHLAYPQENLRHQRDLALRGIRFLLGSNPGGGSSTGSWNLSSWSLSDAGRGEPSLASLRRTGGHSPPVRGSYNPAECTVGLSENSNHNDEPRSHHCPLTALLSLASPESGPTWRKNFDDSPRLRAGEITTSVHCVQVWLEGNQSWEERC